MLDKKVFIAPIKNTPTRQEVYGRTKNPRLVSDQLPAVAGGRTAAG